MPEILDGSNPFKGVETYAVEFDLSLLWYLHEKVLPFLVMENQNSLIAREVTLNLEQAIVMCEDEAEATANILLRVPEVRMMLGITSRYDADMNGRPIGLESQRRLMRGRIALEVGMVIPDPSSALHDRAYEEAKLEGEVPPQEIEDA